MIDPANKPGEFTIVATDGEAGSYVILRTYRCWEMYGSTPLYLTKAEALVPEIERAKPFQTYRLHHDGRLECERPDGTLFLVAVGRSERETSLVRRLYEIGSGFSNEQPETVEGGA